MLIISLTYFWLGEIASICFRTASIHLGNHRGSFTRGCFTKRKKRL